MAGANEGEGRLIKNVGLIEKADSTDKVGFKRRERGGSRCRSWKTIEEGGIRWGASDSLNPTRQHNHVRTAAGIGRRQVP